MGFPGSSAGKESACNAGDPGSIPGWKRASGEGIDYPPQYSWASLVAQSVKKSACDAGHLGKEYSLKKGMATHSSILAWRIPEEPGGLHAVHGVAKSQYFKYTPCNS